MSPIWNYTPLSCPLFCADLSFTSIAHLWLFEDVCMDAPGRSSNNASYRFWFAPGWDLLASFFYAPDLPFLFNTPALTPIFSPALVGSTFVFPVMPTFGMPLAGFLHGGRWSNHTAQIFLTWPSVSSCVRHGCNPLERFPGFVICGPRYAAILGWLFFAVHCTSLRGTVLKSYSAEIIPTWHQWTKRTK
jgi:hypothetical protein